MAEQPLIIDPASILDMTDDRHVEFSGEVDGERRDFAVSYDTLEALDGAAPDAGPVAAFTRHQAAIAAAAVRSLGRDLDQERVVVSESDLD